MKYKEVLRFCLLTYACMLTCLRGIAGENPTLQNVELGKMKGSIAGGAFSISSIKSFNTLLPENQLDMTLLIKRTSPEGAFHWPSLKIDSMVYEEKELIYINSSYNSYYIPIRTSHSIDAPVTLPPLATGNDVMLFGLYLYLSPVEMLPQKYMYIKPRNFVPGIIKQGNYKIYATISTASSTDSVTSSQDAFCFQVKIGVSALPGVDVDYLKSIKEKFALVKKFYSGTVQFPSKDILPFQDETFVNNLNRFAQNSISNKKIVAAACATGFLRQDINKNYTEGVAMDVFDNNDLFFNLFTDWVADVYSQDKYSGLILWLNGPLKIRNSIRTKLGLSPQCCPWNIVPIKFLEK